MNLTEKQHHTLKRAASEIDEIGRMRGTTELFGNHTSRRGSELVRLGRLERLGLLERGGPPNKAGNLNWSEGRVTDVGRALLSEIERLGDKYVMRGHRVSQNIGGLGKDGGSRFPSRVMAADGGYKLSEGRLNPKLGVTVTKGRHRGLKMRAVTLEEGRTCPVDVPCRAICYGGNMHGAKRLRWEGLETQFEIQNAIERAPRLVRLHTLGDFPTADYARATARSVRKSGGAAFGYTAWLPETEIGKEIRRLSGRFWDFWSIRTSYMHGHRRPMRERGAVTVENADQAKIHDAVVCPEQLGQTESCATCGYCWNTRRNVAFIQHHMNR